MLPHWLTHLGGLGLFAVAIFDSSPIPLPLPGSTDLLLLLLVSHHGNPFLLAACAITGSAIGGYITWSAGKKGGEALLQRSVPKRFRARIEHWTDNHSMLSVMVPALLPPPIPLTPFLLAAGALGVSRRRFLVSYNAARLIRYSLVSWAAVTYGRKVVSWWTKNLAEWSGVIGWSFAGLMVAGVIYGIWQYRRQTYDASGKRTMPQEAQA
ncbi:DedA family protein [Acidisarcina polymorpha]|uniref:DedA family protein n=1 Tax=Acidisarcina polymorpha TaxID=2211140 RepID=A0A2Z5G3G2_9BACT|nr:DedA family protein [Acidisarcina polymorpha]